MKIVEVIFAAVVLVTIEAQDEPKAITAIKLETVEVENNAKEDGLEETELRHKKSVISQLDGDADVIRSIDEGHEGDVGSKGIKTAVNESSETSTSSESDSTEPVRPLDNFKNTRRKIILDLFSKMLNTNKEDGQTRRLDIEDNEDDFPVDIDNPRSNDYNHDEVAQEKGNRAFSSYGTVLDVKGRSGLVPVRTGTDSITTNYVNRALRPAISKNGLYMSPSYYPFITPPTMNFGKINNRDLVQPMAPMNSLGPMRSMNGVAYRRAQNHEFRKMYVENENAYQYEPEAPVETHANSWKYLSMN